MFAETYSVGLMGLSAFPVVVEINTEKGTPWFEIVGLGDAAVQESKQRVFAALVNSGVNLKPARITVNLAPASVRKTGSCFDLPILVSLLVASGLISADLSGSAFVGEVSMSGELAAVNGVLSMALAAKENGINSIYVPLKNAREASVVDGLEVFGIKNVSQLIEVLGEKSALAPCECYIPKDEDYSCDADFSDVKGQENIKLAIEVAAAGFHNMLMIGPPGSGKSMLAKRIAGILPPMSFSESIETTRVYSAAGMLDENAPLVIRRPYRPISHTASTVGVIGGGNQIPKPGEISLAHNGVLFMDEFPEFHRDVLEALRQPLEDRQIAITRSVGKVTYPANFMLVTAMNPCPCGNYGSDRSCSCSRAQITRYLGKISQPILDRIDIQTEVNAVSYEQMRGGEKTKSSAEMRENILRAREFQSERFKNTNINFNSEIPPKLVNEICELDAQAEKIISASFNSLGLSARAYDRILKVARTAADLDGQKIIGKRHIAQALQYRSLDRKYWG